METLRQALIDVEGRILELEHLREKLHEIQPDRIKEIKINVTYRGNAEGGIDIHYPSATFFGLDETINKVEAQIAECRDKQNKLLHKLRRDLKFKACIEEEWIYNTDPRGDGWFWDQVNTHGCAVYQYTGLKDKDDKEIYEGDVIIWAREKPEMVYMGVGYDDTHGNWLAWLCGKKSLIDIHATSEVIDNIHHFVSMWKLREG